MLDRLPFTTFLEPIIEGINQEKWVQRSRITNCCNIKPFEPTLSDQCLTCVTLICSKLGMVTLISNYWCGLEELSCIFKLGFASHSKRHIPSRRQIIESAIASNIGPSFPAFLFVNTLASASLAQEETSSSSNTRIPFFVLNGRDAEFLKMAFSNSFKLRAVDSSAVSNYCHHYPQFFL